MLDTIREVIRLILAGDCEGALAVLRGAVTATPPDTIPADGSTDATAALADWLETLVPGTIADFGADQGKTYRLDESLILDGLTGLEIRNASFVIAVHAPTLDAQGRSQRRHLWLKKCHDITLDGLKVSGLNTTDDLGIPIGEDGLARYDSKKEFEHALCVEDSTGIHVTNFHADAVFGDGCYFRRTDNTSITDFRITRNGRQGVAMIAGSHAKILRGEIVHSRRSGIDIEPNSIHEVVEGVEIGHMKIQSRLLPITSGGPGVVRDVWVHDIESRTGSVPILSLVPNSGGRRDDWTVERWEQLNGVGSPLSPIRALNVDNLTVRDFTCPNNPFRTMTGVSLDNAGRVHLERCRFHGGASVQLVSVVNPAENHDLTVVDCEPPLA